MLDWAGWRADGAMAGTVRVFGESYGGPAGPENVLIVFVRNRMGG